MNADLAVRNILATNSTYNAHVSGRIYYNQADQAQLVPIAIIKEDSLDLNDTQSGVSTLNFNWVYVTHMAETKKKVCQMALDGRTALDRNSAGYQNDVIVESVQYQTQRSTSALLVDKKIFVVEQLYKVIVRVVRGSGFDYFLNFQLA